jgi:Immunity protein 27
MFTKIQPNETELVGRWTVENGHIHKDETCERVELLTTQYLRKIAISDKWGAWETLFKDPEDGRYWEQTYPHGEMHGGGPPKLEVISKEEARGKYKIP